MPSAIMDAVGNHLDRHLFQQIDTLNGAGVLEFAHVVEARHTVIEMGSQRVACIPCLLDLGILGCGMADGSDDAFVGDIFAHLNGSRQLGGAGPAPHAVKVFDDMPILVRVGNTDDLGHLGSSLAWVEVRSFQMHAHDGGTGLTHEFITRLARTLNHVKRRRGQCGIDGRCAVFQVGLGCGLKRFSRALLEVTATSAVAMQVNAAWHDIHVMGVNGLVHAVQQAAALGHLLDAAVLDDNRAPLNPPFGGKYLAVVNLSQHSQSFLSL